jgi:hypothetical protein
LLITDITPLGTLVLWLLWIEVLVGQFYVAVVIEARSVDQASMNPDSAVRIDRDARRNPSAAKSMGFGL